jgi:hypothetical protein
MRAIIHYVILIGMHCMPIANYCGTTNTLPALVGMQPFDDLMFNNNNEIDDDEGVFSDDTLSDQAQQTYCSEYFIEDISAEDQLALSRGECFWRPDHASIALLKDCLPIIHTPSTTLQALLCMAAAQGDVEWLTNVLKNCLTDDYDQNGEHITCKALLLIANLPYASNRLACAYSLLQHGVDPNTRNTENGCRPLHYAAYKNNDPLIALLLSHGAKVGYADNIYRYTPLDIALRYSRTDIKTMLLAAKNYECKQNQLKKPRTKKLKQPPIQAKTLR